MTSTPFDFSHAPFDVLSPAERERLAAAVDIAYFPADSCVLDAGTDTDALYVVLKGLVVERDESEALSHYGPRDSFDVRAILDGRVRHRHQTLEDTLLFCLPRPLVVELTQRNPGFGAFFYQDVAARFAALANRPLQGQLQAMLMGRVEAAYLSPVQWLDASTSVLEAARQMKQHHASCVLVRSQDGPGIFTRSDLRDFVIEGASATDTPLGPLARRPLHTIEADSPLYRAQLKMATLTIQRLVVTRQGEVIGLLEQVELLSFLSNHSHIVLALIERATSTTELLEASRRMDALIQSLHGQGVHVDQIAALLGELRRQLFSRLFTLLAPPAMTEHVCLLVLGSEGRSEQILKTDQDNALLVEDGYHHPQLAATCEAFSQALLDFGYPPCPGGIMLSRPEWCCELSVMRHRLLDWARSANAENVMRLAIWADAQPVAGRSALLDGLRLAELVALDAAFLARFALPVTQFEVPLGLFSRLLTEAGSARDRLDIKKGGIFPLVHGLRSLAVKAGLKVCNSFERIDALVQRGLLPGELGRDLRETLNFFQALRLSHGLEALQRGHAVDNLIAPERLSTLERDLLKDALAVVKRFRQHVSHHFQLQRLS